LKSKSLKYAETHVDAQSVGYLLERHVQALRVSRRSMVTTNWGSLALCKCVCRDSQVFSGRRLADQVVGHVGSFPGCGCLVLQLRTQSAEWPRPARPAAGTEARGRGNAENVGHECGSRWPRRNCCVHLLCAGAIRFQWAEDQSWLEALAAEAEARDRENAAHFGMS
jgi:hypothetical protein